MTRKRPTLPKESTKRIPEFGGYNDTTEKSDFSRNVSNMDLENWSGLRASESNQESR